MFTIMMRQGALHKNNGTRLKVKVTRQGQIWKDQDSQRAKIGPILNLYQTCFIEGIFKDILKQDI